MASPANRDLLYRFGVFEVSAEAREIFRHGRKIKLQDQPFELLLFLLERPGEIVDREVLRQRLWPENTFVDFGQSLSTALTKLRQALGDDANNPRFVETVPRRGYRFIAPVTVLNAEEPLPQPQMPAEAPPIADALAVEADKRPSRSNRTRWIAAVALFAVLLALGSGLYLQKHNQSFVLAAKDTIVVADFENTTGEMIFNDTLRQAMMVGLAQSPVIHMLPDRNASVVFKQMGRSPDERITGRSAIELCQRVGGKLTVQGTISSLGTAYLIGLAAIRCDTGKPIAYEQAQVAQKDDAIDALGKATSRLRGRLGESLPSIQKYNAPLEQATTSSLDALNAYGLALSTWDAKGDLASIPYFKKAIELDPNFAMAYGGVAAVYNNAGQAELARESTIKAYRLKDRVTESERASIEARYFLYVTEEVDKAAETYATLAQDYPESAGSLNHLGTTDLRLGRDEQAVEDFRKAIRVDPSRSASYVNLALALLRLDRIHDAQTVLEDADKRGLASQHTLKVNYWIAFLSGDQSAMDRCIAESAKYPGAAAAFQSEQADVEGSHGRYEKAFALSLAAAESAQKAGDKELAASYLAQAAVRDAQVGLFDKARSLSQKASKLSKDKVIVTASALVAAESGDFAKASSIGAELDKQYPHGTFVQNYWLPVIRAETEIGRGEGAKAVGLLAAAQPLDPSVADGFSSSPIFPDYVLAKAWLAAKDGAKSGDEFQKLIDHRGQVLSSPLGSLAWLGRARAYALAGRMAEARDAYGKFFALWKDADAKIPLLKQARVEADRLKVAR